MRQFTCVSLFLILPYFVISQSDSLKKKHKQWYFSWGYTRVAYSKSSIHFKDVSQKYHPYTGKNANYDFTVYNVNASDKPDFDKLKDVINITIPQFVSRIGYCFNDKWGIEMSYDHAKYVVNNWQKARIKGQIDGKAIDGDTILDPDRFLHFEHTDGANFWMVNAVRKFILYTPSNKFILSAVVKPGAGVVFPRTDITLFGEQLNNNWKVAGWIVGVESGLRIEFLKYGIFELVVKGVYADYVNTFVLGVGNGKASHHFFAAQATATMGLKFGY